MSHVYRLSVEKKSVYRPNPEKYRSQISDMLKNAIRGARINQKWVNHTPINAPKAAWDSDSQQWIARFTFTFEKLAKSDSDEIRNRQYEDLVYNLKNKAKYLKWEILPAADAIAMSEISISREVHSQTQPEVPLVISQVEASPALKSSPINTNPKGFFDHFVDREAQINVLMGAIQTAVETDFQVCNHVCLFGNPSSGKSSLLKAVTNMVGEEYVYKIDATTTTQAGFLNDISENGLRPKFICIDEPDKIDIEKYGFLLALMDDRKEIRMNNARSGPIHIPLPCLIIIAVNNIYKFDNAMDGALSSRTSNKIYCPDMTLEIMRKAVRKGIEAINPKDEWIDKAIEYAKMYEPSADTRRLGAIVAGGRARLETGEYQRVLRATSQSQSA